MSINIGDVYATLRLRDELTGVFKSAQRSLTETQNQFASFEKTLSASEMQSISFGRAFGTALGVATAATGALVAGVTAVTAAITTMGERGANVGDMEDSFARLTERAGVDTVNALEQLRKGVGGLMTDFDMMKSINRALAADLKLSEDQFYVVGRAARVLSEQTGENLSSALDKVTLALTTGRTRGLAAAGMFIEMKDAVKETSDAMDAMGEEMGDAQKIEAQRKAVLEALTTAVERHGEIQTDFGDIMDRARTNVKNWFDALAQAVSESPAWLGMLQQTGVELERAFGPNAQGLITAIVNAIELFAFTMIEWGQTTLTVIDGAMRTWETLKATVLTVMTGISGAVNIITDSFVGLYRILADGAAAIASWIPGGEGMAVALRNSAQSAQNFSEANWNVTRGLAAQQQEAVRGIAGQHALRETIDGTRGALDRIKEAMIVGQGATDKLADSTAKLKDATEGAGTAAKSFEEIYKSAFEAMSMFSAEQQKNIEIGLKMGRSIGDIAKAMHLSKDAVTLYADEWKKVEAAIKQTSDATRKAEEEHKRAVDSIREQLFGLDAIKKAMQYAEALDQVGNISYMTSEKQKEFFATIQQGLTVLNALGEGSSQAAMDMQQLLGATQATATALEGLTIIGGEASKAVTAFTGATQTGPATPAMSEGGQPGGISGDVLEAYGRSLKGIGSTWHASEGFRSLPMFADGGIVSKPTVARLGERGVPEMVVPMGKGMGGTTVVVQVDARESFYDTPAGVQRMADKVGDSVIAKLRTSRLA